MPPENSQRGAAEQSANQSATVYHAGRYSDDSDEVQISRTIAEAVGIPVVTTSGPYRSYNVHYTVHSNPAHVHLDFHSPAPARGYDVVEVIADVRNDIAHIADSGANRSPSPP